MKPTITLKDFMAQAIRTHDELQELVHIIQVETLPLLAASTFNEEDVPELAKALNVLKKILAAK
jgi:replicative DNA helicase